MPSASASFNGGVLAVSDPAQVRVTVSEPSAGNVQIVLEGDTFAGQAGTLASGITFNGNTLTVSAPMTGLSIVTGGAIVVMPGASITTPGSITLIGHGEATQPIGVSVTGATLSGSSVSITGYGFTGPGDSNFGVLLNGQARLTGGTGGIWVTGVGGSGSGRLNIGDWISDPGTAVTAVGGPVNIDGTGNGTATHEDGVDIVNGALVAATDSSSGASGTVTVMGNAAPGGQIGFGVWIGGNGTRVSTQSGALTIYGNTDGTNVTSGGGNSCMGIDVDVGAVVASSPGQVVLVGSGGMGTGSSDFGVRINGATVSGGTNGSGLSITGYGNGTGGMYEDGIDITNGAQVSSASSLTVTGVGGPGGNGSAKGVWISGVSATQPTVVSAPSHVTINGTGGGGAGGYNIGVVVTAYASVSASAAGGGLFIDASGGGSGSHDSGLDVTNHASIDGLGYCVVYANISPYASGSSSAFNVDTTSSANACLVDGAIGGEYAALAQETDARGRTVQQLLGAPTSNEVNVPGVAGALMINFQGGTIYWSPSTGAHVVYGAIVAEYNALANELDANSVPVQAALGLPTSDEANVPGVPGARVSNFQGGAIYWSSATGAHVVYGAIGTYYNSVGGAGSSLGLPTTDELPDGVGGRFNVFQNGSIRWSSSAGAYAVSWSPATGANALPITSVSDIGAVTGLGSRNQTQRWQVGGADLGSFFESAGQLYMVFGDTYQSSGSPNSSSTGWRSGTLAEINLTGNYDNGLPIAHFITDQPSHAAAIFSSPHGGIDPRTGVYEVTKIPTYGFSVNGTMYLQFMSIKAWTPWTTNYSGLAKSTDGGQTWQIVPNVTWAGSSNFAQVAVVSNSPDDGYLYFFGIPAGRHGNVELARVPANQVENQASYQYLSANGVWSSQESNATPIVQGSVGELSVLWNPYLGQWLMTDLNGSTNNLEIRSATSLTGPWSAPQTLATGREYPGLYGAYMSPALMKNGGQTVYFAMSIWGDYNVQLMSMTFANSTTGNMAPPSSNGAVPTSRSSPTVGVSGASSGVNTAIVQQNAAGIATVSANGHAGMANSFASVIASSNSASDAAQLNTRAHASSADDLMLTAIAQAHMDSAWDGGRTHDSADLLWQEVEKLLHPLSAARSFGD